VCHIRTAKVGLRFCCRIHAGELHAGEHDDDDAAAAADDDDDFDYNRDEFYTCI